MPPDSPSEPIIPDSIEPYIGYKALQVSAYSNLLHSPAFPFVWPAGHKAVASCFQFPPTHSDAPHRDCCCGFYVANAVWRRRVSMYLHVGEGVVVRVALWGRTIVASKGARGQFAYPQEIVAWTCHDSKIQAVAENYCIGLATENKGFWWPHAGLVVET